MNRITLPICALLSISGLSAQVASVSIVDSIVLISNVGGSNYNNELVLFRADGTYQDIAVTSHFSGGGIPTSPPSSGTYSYTVSIGEGWAGPQTVGTITWTNGESPRAPLTLWFVSPTSGQPFVSGAGVLSSFGVFPRVALTGATNVSNNSWISASHPTTPGFVIEGDSPRWVLIRGAGPSLAQFGVPSPVANPAMVLSGGYSSFTSVNLQNVYSNDGATGAETVGPWSSDPNLVAGLQAMFSLAGAFQYTGGSSDCAGLVLLAPGAYTVQGSTTGAAGQLLTEIYVLPYGM